MANPWEMDWTDPTPSSSPKPATARTFNNLTPERAQQVLSQAEASINKRLAGNPDAAALAIQKLHADPRLQPIRQAAGLTPVSTRKAEVQKIAQQNVDVAKKLQIPALSGFNDLTDAAENAASRMMFGIPERIGAAINYYTGLGKGKSYQDQLAIERATTDLQRDRSSTGNVLGTIAGALAGGNAGAGLVKAGASRLAASSAPAIAKIGNILQTVGELKKGRALSNIAKTATAGAAGGAAQAAGEGSDIGSGAEAGAIAAPAFSAVAKGVGAGAKAVRNLAGFEPVENILAKYVKTPISQIQQAMDTRAQQGLPSSIYEVLPLGDRQALDDAIGKMPAAARERLAATVRQRAGNIGEETSNRVQQIVRPTGPDQIRSKIASDLAASRGASGPNADEIALAERAARSPIEMRTVQEQEGQNIMRPFDTKHAYDSVNDLVPQQPIQGANGTIQMSEIDPEIGATIRRAAGVLRVKDSGLNFRDVTRIMSHLSNQTRRGGIEGDAAAQALNHIQDTVSADHPEVASAIERMRDAWKTRANMMAGVQEGARTRLRENVPVDSAEDARNVRQAFDTPEGSAGRALGQASQLERNLLTSSGKSLGAMNDIATNPTTQRAISTNLGNDAGENIADVARMQTESARRLSGLDREAAQETGSDPAHMLSNLMMLSPGTLPHTKALALSRLVKGAVRIPEKQAQTMVDMLFSQNPTNISRAITAINRVGGQDVLRTIGRDIAVGSLGASGNQEPAPDEEVPAEAPTTAPEQEQGPWNDDYSDLPRGHAIVQSVFPEAHITSDVRSPDDPLSKENPHSYHTTSQNAVDVRPIPGMSFSEFISKLHEAGYKTVEAIDEVNHPSRYATGPHWHVVLAG